MSTLPDSSMPDPNEPTFDPGLDVAILVFSHVEHVKTRLNLARVSKLWLQASKPAAAYPSRFDFDAFPRMDGHTRLTRVIGLLDNDEALSLPYERVVGLLGGPAKFVCDFAACRGSVRLLKWARENNLLGVHTRANAQPQMGHLPALQYLHENGCPWDMNTCTYAAYTQTLGLPAVRGGQQVPGVGDIRQVVREAPQMNTSPILVSNERFHASTVLLDSSHHQSSSESASCPSYASNVTTSLMSPSMPV